MQILLDRVSAVIGGTMDLWRHDQVLYWAAKGQVGEMTLSLLVPLFGAMSVIVDMLSKQILKIWRISGRLPQHGFKRVLEDKACNLR